MAQYVAIRALNRSARIRVPAVLPAPTAPAAAAVGSGGTFAAGTYYYKIVSVDAAGNVSLPSSEVNATVVNNGSVNLTWTAAPGAVSYRIYRGTASNGESVYQTTTNADSFTDTGAAGTSGTVPTVATGEAVQGLSTATATVVDLDNVDVRRALGHHSSVGQFVVVAANNTYGPAGSKVTLPSNS